jgi:hypothetical protein
MDSRWYTPDTNLFFIDTEVYVHLWHQGLCFGLTVCYTTAGRLRFHPPYILDVTSIDFYLLGPLKMQLLCNRFWTDVDVRQAVTSQLQALYFIPFCVQTHVFVPRWSGYLNVDGDYIDV